MKALISTLFIAFAMIGSGQLGYAANVPISGQDSNTLVMIFEQAGMRFEPSIDTNRSFITSRGVHCILQIRAPGAAFMPNCSVRDRFNREFRVDERQMAALVNILTRARVRPVRNNSEITLTSQAIFCQTVQASPADPVTSSCYLGNL
jgi:hypothetical protein